LVDALDFFDWPNWVTNFSSSQQKIQVEAKNDKALTLFRPGGGRILPAPTLDFYNFFNKQVKATKLGDFS